ncbi:MAG: phosphoribosylglycinamide formyltransferase [Methanomassiliicoccales archaeon]
MLPTICVMASGNGTTMEAIAKACSDGRVGAHVSAVIVDNPGAGAVERAVALSLRTVVIERKRLGGEYSAVLLRRLKRISPDLICLAGYMRILDENIIAPFSGRILNIHPSLLPAFGGKGMYGDRVHEAVLRSGARKTGCTVHFVTGEVDMGPVIMQKEVDVLPDDTVETLRERVHREELELYPRAIFKVLLDMFGQGRDHKTGSGSHEGEAHLSVRSLLAPVNFD